MNHLLCVDFEPLYECTSVRALKVVKQACSIQVSTYKRFMSANFVLIAMANT